MAKVNKTYRPIRSTYVADGNILVKVSKRQRWHVLEDDGLNLFLERGDVIIKMPWYRLDEFFEEIPDE